MTMPSPMQTPSASPKRAPLHERTQSQTNERAFPSPVRSIQEKEDLDVYSTTPYPTKSTQVLLPTPGKGQGYAFQDAFRVSDSSLVSAETQRTATGHVDDGRDLGPGMNFAWELSSSVDVGPSSSQVWEDDPNSSQSSFPTPVFPSDEDDTFDHKIISGLQPIHPPESQREQEQDDPQSDTVAVDHVDDNDEDEVIILPSVRSTVKPVPPRSSSSNSGSVDYYSNSDNFVAYDHTSSPNVVPIGAPSSPNFVSLESSSPNLIPLGESSPNVVTTKRSDSSFASSSNSLGTVLRTYNPAGIWDGPSSEGVDSQPASFHSSPPEQLLKLYQSTSSLALSATEANRSRSGTNSTNSGHSAVDIQTVIDSGTPVQYPKVRAPSSSSSYAESTTQTPGVSRPARAMTERSSARWNPRLSTVPSQWSDEAQLSVPSASASDANESLSGGKADLTRLRSKTSSTIWVVNESRRREHLDSLSNPPQSSLRHIPSAFLGSHSSGSRSNSLRNLGRPGSSSSGSVILNTLPNWVRLYYRGNGQAPQNPALIFLDTSRPSTAASRPTSPVRYISQVPVTITRPRTRPHDNNSRPARLITDHPADPRSHWMPGQQQMDLASGDEVIPPLLPKAWSPHLHPDKGQSNPRSTWIAPSVDSTQEPTFGRRNVQIYSFCLGFVFPLGEVLTPSSWSSITNSIPVWLIAAFLPLPPRPTADDDTMIAGPGVQLRIAEYEARRYQNARWWRNVNRVMIPIGAAIIGVIVCAHECLHE